MIRCMALTTSPAYDQSRFACTLPSLSPLASPLTIFATPSVIFLVTNSIPRNGPSKLKQIEEQQNIPYDSRQLTVAKWAIAFATAYGLRGWKGVNSVWGVSRTR